MDVEVSPLAAGWDWVSLSSLIHRLDYSRALLFKSAMGPAATGNGGRFCGIRYLGLMADAETTNVSRLRGSVSERARLVALHPPFA
jgi:hypothetical protein